MIQVDVAGFRAALPRFLKMVRDGALIIYPTDTIYGIGCDATNDSAVQKIRTLKQRDKKPFSVIAPSKAWIEENCVLPEAAKEWLVKLPGPYTLILKVKNIDVIAKSVTGNNATLGVRIPGSWIADVVSALGRPLVTTSVNTAGQPHAVAIESIDHGILDAIDIVVDEGERSAHPSTIVDLTGEEEVMIRR